MWRSSKWDRCWQILCVVINNTATWSYHLHGYTDLLDGKHKSGLLRGGLVFLVIGDRAIFLLVIWWFVHEKIGDLVILKSCGDGDLAIILLVIWWLVPQKIGDLVILRSCGDGDLPIFCWYFCDKYMSETRAKGA